MKTLSHTLFALLACTLLTFAKISLAEQPATAEAGLISVETGKVNINTADAKTLSKVLKGVGLKKAEAIIEYRKTFGPFSNIHELESVNGIGRSTVEKNANLIAVN